MGPVSHIGIKHILALPAASVLAALALVASPAHAQAQGQQVDGSNCAKVTLLGLRGSDPYEHMEVGVHAPAHGWPAIDPFGWANTDLADRIVKALPEQATVARLAVSYTVSNDGPTNSPTDPAKYRAAVRAAVAVTQTTAAALVKKCPHTKLVLLGYEEGAQVIHESLPTMPLGVGEAISAVVMTADPLRDPKDSGVDNFFGSPSKTPPYDTGGWMIGSALLGAATPEMAATMRAKKEFAPTVSASIPAGFAGRVEEVCSGFDSACLAVAPQRPFAEGGPTDEYRLGKMLDRPAQLVVDRIGNICGDITFFAARGSGEVGADAEPAGGTRIPGFGDTLTVMARAIEKGVTRGGEVPASIDHVAVDYPAASVESALAQLVIIPRPESNTYALSVGIGIAIDHGQKQFRDLIQTCPDTKVVMLGYSQGGHVIHEILQNLSASEISHVRAAVLVADAVRNPEDGAPYQFLGLSVQLKTPELSTPSTEGAIRMVSEADRSCGASEPLPPLAKIGTDVFGMISDMLTQTVKSVCSSALASVPRFSEVVTPRKLPEATAGRVMSVCSNDDAVCNMAAPASAGILGIDVDRLKLVGSVHGRGYMNPGFYTAPALFAVGRLAVRS